MLVERDIINFRDTRLTSGAILNVSEDMDIKLLK